MCARLAWLLVLALLACALWLAARLRCHEITPLGPLPYRCALVPLGALTSAVPPSGVVVGFGLRADICEN